MIGFAAPLFGALVLAAAYVWFLHSRREYRTTVHSLALWRQLQTHGALKPKARLLPPLTLPLILQLLVVALLAAALTQPFWGSRAVPDHLVVVVDTGAAMQARAEGRSLFDLAKTELQANFGDRWQKTPQRFSIIAAGPQPSYAAARWPWANGPADGLDRLAVSDGQTDWAQTARLVAPVLNPAESSEVLLVSASTAPAVFTALLPDIAVTERILAPDSGNSAISGTLSLADAATNRWRLDGHATLAEGTQTLSIAIQYAADSSRTPLEWQTVTVERPEDGTAVPFSQEIELPGPGIVTAFLPPDANANDNRLRFIAEPALDQLDVLYVGDGAQPLLRALNAVTGVRIFQDDAIGANAADFGLVLAETQIAAPPATNLIAIETAGDPLDNPDPDFWTSGHPLSRDIDWSALEIAAATGLEAAEGETVLLSARGVPLITAAATENGRHIRIGFDIASSNWPQTSGFPVFAANLIDWIGRTPGATPATSCTIGLPCRLDARLMGQPIVNLEAPRAPQTVLGKADFVPQQTGLFRIGQGERIVLFAVNPALVAPEASEDIQTAPFALPMGLAFWLLCAALALLVFEAVASRQSQRAIPRPSVLRLATLALLAAALINIPWPWLGSDGQTVFVVPGIQSASSAPASDRAGAIAAGAATQWISDVGAGAVVSPEILRLTHSDTAIELAAAMLDRPDGARIVLAGDTIPNPRLGQQLAARGITVDYLSPPDLDANELYVGALDLPQGALTGDAIPITALVHSLGPQSVTMTIATNGDTIADQTIDLDAGQNRIEAILPPLETGETLVELSLSGSDPHPQNDALGRIVTTAPVRPIAIISADPAHGEAMAALLETQDLEATVFEPRRAPYYLKDWLGFGDIVLLNTPALSLTTLQQTLMETVVRDHGMGLLMLGGPNSFGPGGYFGTALETISPLSARVPQDAPEVVMVFVLDRSGSMQQPVGDGNRLDVAKSATLSATELLNPQSQVGIIAFDAEARTLLPLTRLADEPGAVQSALEGFDPGGGTSIYPGLLEALDMLDGVDAPAKHVIVMTDGLSQPGDFPGIVGALRATGATVSAVAIGQGADNTTARTIAELGGGTAHITSDFAALPSILSQEAMLLASPIEEIANQPVWQDRSANFLSALPPALPPLLGFVGTTAKPEADLAITTTDAEGRDMPVLAHWRYGNGMVMALATDATGPWSQAWQALPQYGAFWSDILLQFQPTTPRPGLTLATQGNGDYLDLRVSALDIEGMALTGQALSAAVTPPSGAEPETLPLVETRPGLYEARRILDETGRYAIAIVSDEDTGPIETAYYHSYDPRYDFSRSGGAAALARATGGQALDAGEIATIGAGYALDWQRHWPLWALAAFAFFLIDLTLRYRGLSQRRKVKPRVHPDDPRQGALSS